MSGPSLASPPPPLRRRELVLALVVAAAVLLPGLGSYTLIDPWETHYGEVARRMLADHDWVHLKWQDEAFRSKPVLTFWLMAAGLRALGVAADGGWSGEMTVGDAPVIGLRLPFALFGVLGAVMVWWMLRRLIGQRAAWFGLVAVLATPFYDLVARQAITDMPMVASVMAALACFAVAVADGDAPVRPIWKRLDGRHLFALVAALVVGGQGVYLWSYFVATPKLAAGLKVWQPGLVVGGGTLAALAALLVLDLVVVPIRTQRDLAMRWFYLFVGVSVLAKGPPGIGMVGACCFFYVLIEWDWKLLGRLSIPQGVVWVAAVSLPWHVAMYLKDGRAWYREYVNHHMLNRFGSGVFGDRGTFDYFTSQLAIGLFPLIGLAPFALAWLCRGRFERTPEGRARLVIGLWTMIGFATFALSQTRFHHYVAPVAPAIALVVALWLDAAWRDLGRSLALAALGGALTIALVARDLVAEQKQLIELFVFRYDRPWPSKVPWEVDVGAPILALAALALLATAALAVRRLRRPAIVATLVTALGFSVWAETGYMQAAAPHWGQRALHRTYLARRGIHGVEIRYGGARELADDWQGGAYRVETVLPDGFAAGAPMRARLTLPAAGLPKDTIELHGVAADLGDHAFTIRLDEASRAALAPLIARGRTAAPSARPWVQVDADRLIAWQLNWRGENFWSNGEIYGETDDTRTVFIKTDNTEFNKYIKDPARAGRRFFVITEAGRAENLRSLLPTQHGKDTVEKIDTSCNKFTLLTFEL